MSLSWPFLPQWEQTRFLRDSDGGIGEEELAGLEERRAARASESVGASLVETDGGKAVVRRKRADAGLGLCLGSG